MAGEVLPFVPIANELHIVPSSRADDPRVFLCQCGLVVLERSDEEPRCTCGAAPCNACAPARGRTH